MRYFPQNSEDIRQMLETIGVSSVEELFHRAIPDSNRCCEPLKLAPALSEPEIARYFQERERENLCSGYTLFLGGGCYNHYVPEAVNALSSKAEFVTPYTPYQPEISQGTLQAIFEYQTMVSSLTGMEYSNASLYDGATAAAEGILMAWRMTKKTRFLVARSVHPEYLATIRTYVRNFGLVVELIDTDEFGMVCPLSFEKLYDESVGAVMVQSPNFFGVIEEYGWIKEKIGESKCLLISVTAEALSLGYLKSPAAWGADIAVGEAQSFGLYPSFGGPGLGFFTTSNKKFLWEMPGRVVGETVDTEGKTGYVLTLSTREQHIRRERATSNICSNQAWCPAGNGPLPTSAPTKPGALRGLRSSSPSWVPKDSERRPFRTTARPSTPRKNWRNGESRPVTRAPSSTSLWSSSRMPGRFRNVSWKRKSSRAFPSVGSSPKRPRACS